MNLQDLFEEYRIQFILGLAGLFLFGVGVMSVVLVSLKQSEPEVEILSTDEASKEETGEVVVDVEGAVEKPGVFSLPSGSRLNDALVAAGGLSIKADREWVSKYINLALLVSDGLKIYIPAKGETDNKEVPVSSFSDQEFQGQVVGLQTAGTVNINTASTKELDNLWGIGEKRAAAIIDNRPYQRVEELMEKKIIPANVYERIKDQISAY